MKNLTATLCLTLAVLLGSVENGNTTDLFKNLENETVSRLEFQLQQICGDLIREFDGDSRPVEKDLMDRTTRDVFCTKTDKSIEIFVLISGEAKGGEAYQNGVGRYITKVIPNKYAIEILQYFGNSGDPNDKNVYGNHIVAWKVYNRFQSRYHKYVESNPQILKEILENFIPLIRITVDITAYNLPQTQKGYRRIRYEFDLLSKYQRVGLVFSPSNKRTIFDE